MNKNIPLKHFQTLEAQFQNMLILTENKTLPKYLKFYFNQDDHVVQKRLKQ